MNVSVWSSLSVVWTIDLFQIALHLECGIFFKACTALYCFFPSELLQYKHSSRRGYAASIRSDLCTYGSELMFSFAISMTKSFRAQPCRKLTACLFLFSFETMMELSFYYSQLCMQPVTTKHLNGVYPAASKLINFHWQ